MKRPTAHNIGVGTRVAVYEDPVTRTNLEGMATIRAIRRIATVYIDALPMLEVFALVRFDEPDNPARVGLVERAKHDLERFIYLKP